MTIRQFHLLFVISTLSFACIDPVGEEPGDATPPAEKLSPLDEAVYAAMDEHGAATPDPGSVLPEDDPKVQLGQMLFFDPILSGNEDIACATCHHPSFGSGDARALPVGVGGVGLGPNRRISAGREFIPRNSPEIFNRGATAWTTMFWDNRVSGDEQTFYSPAGDELPDDLDSVLAVQAMFPVTSADEMRGTPGENEIADAEDLTTVWYRLALRLKQIEGYRTMFARAYPDLSTPEIGFEHAANAIAAFEVSAFTMLDSPYDRYLAGDTDALTSQQKQGALLFFGDANCASCHNGSLLTDQQTHVLGVPQVGPGKGEDAPLDIGRMLQTGDETDKYAFRTPPLRNVAATAPYMHSGVYDSLRDAVRHHLEPESMVAAYDRTQIERGVETDLLDDEAFRADCMRRISPQLAPKRPLSETEFDALVAFLWSMTDPAALDMEHLVPESVPSGLPVER